MNVTLKDDVAKRKIVQKKNKVLKEVLVHEEGFEYVDKEVILYVEREELVEEPKVETSTVQRKVIVVCIIEKVNQVNIRTVIQLLHYNGESSINA